jgi:hypothetical protein
MSRLPSLPRKQAYSRECLILAMKHDTGWALWWFEQQYSGILLVPLLTFMAELLQGSMWTGRLGVRCIPWSRRYFRTMMQFSTTTTPQITQLEPFCNGFKSMTVNFSIFPGQHGHHIGTSLNHSGQFLRLEWGTVSSPTSLQQLYVFQGEWYKITLRTVKTWARSFRDWLQPYWR